MQDNKPSVKDLAQIMKDYSLEELVCKDGTVVMKRKSYDRDIAKIEKDKQELATQREMFEQRKSY